MRAAAATVALGLAACSAPTPLLQHHPTPAPRQERSTVPYTPERDEAVLLARSSPTLASRSEQRSPLSTTTLEVTAYCWTGNHTASGPYPTIGMAAGNRWSFGTRIRVPGYGIVVINDRIGWGSDLDLYIDRRDGACEHDAAVWGRRTMTVEVLP